MSTSNTTELERRVATLTERSTAVAVGRSAWGLFGLLSIWRKDSVPQKIALPSFLCQSPLVSVLLAEWEPEFCDVDPETGNVPTTEWRRVIDSGVDAVFFVHLFGNVGDAGHVADICRARGIYFIEDAAQSFGGAWEGRACGSYGDAAIISFGHTKLIDVGHGGMVLTNDSKLTNEIRNFENNYSRYIPDISTVTRQFREMFYAARRQLGSTPEVAKEGFKGLAHICAPLIPARWKPEVSEEILARLDCLDSLVRERREKNEIYRDMLRDTALTPLSMSPGSVPWRAVFRLPGIGWAEQETISEAVRMEGVDISNWYIPSHWLMEDTCVPVETLESTERISKEIFQLWIDDGTDRDKVKHAASMLTIKLNGAGYG